MHKVNTVNYINDILFQYLFLDSLNYCFAQFRIQRGRIPVWGIPNPLLSAPEQGRIFIQLSTGRQVRMRESFKLFL